MRTPRPRPPGAVARSYSRDRRAPRLSRPAVRGAFPSPVPKILRAPEPGHLPGPPERLQLGAAAGGAGPPKAPCGLCPACLGLYGVWGREGGQRAFLRGLQTPRLSHEPGAWDTPARGGLGHQGGPLPPGAPPHPQFLSRGTEVITDPWREQNKVAGGAGRPWSPEHGAHAVGQVHTGCANREPHVCAPP